MSPARGADTRVCRAETHLGACGGPRHKGRDESRPCRHECLRHFGGSRIFPDFRRSESSLDPADKSARATGTSIVCGGKPSIYLQLRSSPTAVLALIYATSVYRRVFCRIVFCRHRF